MSIDSTGKLGHLSGFLQHYLLNFLYFHIYIILGHGSSFARFRGTKILFSILHIQIFFHNYDEDCVLSKKMCNLERHCVKECHWKVQNQFDFQKLLPGFECSHRTVKSLFWSLTTALQNRAYVESNGNPLLLILKKKMQQPRVREWKWPLQCKIFSGDLV